MKFNTFQQLIESLKSHPEFSNEIKLKRLKKQLDILSNYQNPSTIIEQIQLTSVGIQLLVKNTFRDSTYHYKMLLDFEYPFNRPFIFYLKKDSTYAQAKDLLDLLLQGTNWGPSLMLTFFLDKIQAISQKIRQNVPFQNNALYHLNQNYRRAFVQEMQIKLFQVEEYSWKYLIKSTKKCLIGLNNETFLLFSPSKADQNMILDFYKPISEFSKAKASVSSNKKFNLQISYKQNEKQTKLYFGGDSGVETILGFLNPIQMIERKVAQLQKNSTSPQANQYWNDNTEMIQDFTKLIEYYSLKDSARAEKYIRLMKEMIAKFYQSENFSQQQKDNNKVQIQKEQIQT